MKWAGLTSLVKAFISDREREIRDNRISKVESSGKKISAETGWVEAEYKDPQQTPTEGVAALKNRLAIFLKPTPPANLEIEEAGGTVWTVRFDENGMRKGATLIFVHDPRVTIVNYWLHEQVDAINNIWQKDMWDIGFYR